MHGRFERIDQSLGELHQEMVQRFDRLENYLSEFKKCLADFQYYSTDGTLREMRACLVVRSRKLAPWCLRRFAKSNEPTLERSRSPRTAESFLSRNLNSPLLPILYVLRG
jgi:hypothetical protein